MVLVSNIVRKTNKKNKNKQTNNQKQQQQKKTFEREYPSMNKCNINNRIGLKTIYSVIKTNQIPSVQCNLKRLSQVYCSTKIAEPKSSH